MGTSPAWHDLLKSAVSDRVSGASGVSGDAASVLMAYGQQASPVSLEGLKGDLRVISHELLGAQPAMASVVNLLDEVWRALDERLAVGVALATIHDIAHAYKRKAWEAVERVAQHALSILPSGAHVVTISASGTVLSALLYAQREGVSFRVTGLESRPMLEGQILAAQLAEAGVAVTLTVDAAAYDNVRHADVLLVGADALAQDGLVGKVGTAGMALAARVFEIPAYVLADRTKIWSTSLGMPTIRERLGDEVWADPPPSVELCNRYFDVAEWEAFKGVVTEDGVVSVEDILREGCAKPVCQELAALYGEVSEER